MAHHSTHPRHEVAEAVSLAALGISLAIVLPLLGIAFMAFRAAALVGVIGAALLAAGGWLLLARHREMKRTR